MNYKVSFVFKVGNWKIALQHHYIALIKIAPLFSMKSVLPPYTSSTLCTKNTSMKVWKSLSIIITRRWSWYQQPKNSNSASSHSRGAIPTFSFRIFLFMHLWESSSTALIESQGEFGIPTFSFQIILSKHLWESTDQIPGRVSFLWLHCQRLLPRLATQVKVPFAILETNRNSVRSFENCCCTTQLGQLIAVILKVAIFSKLLLWGGNAML